MISSLLDWLRIQILYSAHISHQLITIHSTSAAAPPPLFLLVPFIFSSFRSCLYSNIFSKAPRWWEYLLQWALDKRGVRIYCSFYSVDSPQSLDTLDFSLTDLAEEDGLQGRSLVFLPIVVRESLHLLLEQVHWIHIDFRVITLPTKIKILVFLQN